MKQPTNPNGITRELTAEQIKQLQQQIEQAGGIYPFAKTKQGLTGQQLAHTLKIKRCSEKVMAKIFG